MIRVYIIYHIILQNKVIIDIERYYTQLLIKLKKAKKHALKVLFEKKNNKDVLILCYFLILVYM